MKVLEDADIEFQVVDDTVHVGGIVLRPVHRRTVPRPDEIERIKDEAGNELVVLVVPYMNRSDAEELKAQGISWLDEAGNSDVRFPGVVISRRVTTTDPGRVSTNRLPTGTGSYSLVRSFLADPAQASKPQYEIAEQMGVTQARVSQVLRHLRSNGMLEGKRSDRSIDRSALLEAFIAEYPGPGGVTSRYYSLSAPTETAERLVDKHHDQVRISGDVAADRIAPLRVPTSLRAYLTDGVAIDAADLSLVPAQGDEANVELITPQDSTVFAMPGPWADIALVAWDLNQQGGSDRLQALDALAATVAA